MFGRDDPGEAVEEVSKEWKELIESVEDTGDKLVCDRCGDDFHNEKALTDHVLQEHRSEAVDRYGEENVEKYGVPADVYEDWGSRISAGSGSIADALHFGGLSRWQMVGYMGGFFFLLILIATLGLGNLWMAPFTLAAGVYLTWKGSADNPLPLFLGIAFLAHPAVLALLTIGLDFRVIGALTGLLGFVLAGLDRSIENLKPAAFRFFQILAALMLPVWALSLANVVLSILSMNFLTVGFLAMLVTVLGTSAYLLAAGFIVDAVGVWKGLGRGVGNLYAHVMLGHEVHGSAGYRMYASTIGSIVLFYYALVLVQDPAAIPLGGIFARNALFPFLLGMLGPIAFYHFLRRLGLMAEAGVEFGRNIRQEYREGRNTGVARAGVEQGASDAKNLESALSGFDAEHGGSGGGGADRGASGGREPDIGVSSDRIEQLGDDVIYAQQLQDEADERGVAVRPQESKIDDALQIHNAAKRGKASRRDIEMAEREITNAIQELEDALGY